MEIIYKRDLDNVNWNDLKETLQQDHFDNGRTSEQLETSFANSYVTCLAIANGKVIGTARALSDGICNAYIVDVWVLSDLQKRGIGARMVEEIISDLQGQHVYLQTDEQIEFFKKLGFVFRPYGLEKVIGKWLVNNS